MTSLLKTVFLLGHKDYGLQKYGVSWKSPEILWHLRMEGKAVADNKLKPLAFTIGVVIFLTAVLYALTTNKIIVSVGILAAGFVYAFILYVKSLNKEKHIRLGLDCSGGVATLPSLALKEASYEDLVIVKKIVHSEKLTIEDYINMQSLIEQCDTRSLTEVIQTYNALK